MTFNDIKKRLTTIEYQLLRDFPTVPTDEQLTKMAFNILQGALREFETFVDTDLPTTVLGCTIDWTYGGNDTHNVSISKGDAVIAQSLSDDLLSLVEILLNALGISKSINGNVTVPDVGYITVNDETTYTDALNLALEIKGVI